MAGNEVNVGSRVRLVGLSGRVELNEKTGLVVGKSEDRYTVKLDEGTEIRVKPANLLQLRNLEQDSPSKREQETLQLTKDSENINSLRAKSKRARFADEVVAEEVDETPSKSMKVLEQIEQHESGDEDEIENDDPPYSTRANEVVTIRLIRNRADKGISFDLRSGYTHQVFFQENKLQTQEKIHEELIIGYVRPRVEIIYASGSLKPWFDFKFESKVDIRQLRKENLTHTNVIKSIENATKFCDYARLQGAVHAESDLAFEPVGELVGEFPAPRTVEELVEGTGAEASGGRLVLHHFVANSADSVRLALRLQTLVVWLIECGGCIEVPDENWHVITLYHATPMQDRTIYCLVGFVTAYRYWAYDKFEKQIDKCRLRLSQCVVLPPFQRKGHASRLLRAVYQLACANERIMDVTVEDPSPDFQAMRDVADACMLEAELGGGLAELLKGSAALVDIGRKFKLCMRQLRRLADVAEFHKAGLTDPTADPEGCTLEALIVLRRRIKKRLYHECLIQQGRGLVENHGHEQNVDDAGEGIKEPTALTTSSANDEDEDAAAARVWGPDGDPERRKESLRLQFAELFRRHSATAARVITACDKPCWSSCTP